MATLPDPRLQKNEMGGAGRIWGDPTKKLSQLTCDSYIRTGVVWCDSRQQVTRGMEGGKRLTKVTSVYLFGRRELFLCRYASFVQRLLSFLAICTCCNWIPHYSRHDFITHNTFDFIRLPAMPESETPAAPPTTQPLADEQLTQSWSDFHKKRWKGPPCLLQEWYLFCFVVASGKLDHNDGPATAIFQIWIAKCCDGLARIEGHATRRSPPDYRATYFRSCRKFIPGIPLFWALFVAIWMFKRTGPPIPMFIVVATYSWRYYARLDLPASQWVFKGYLCHFLPCGLLHYAGSFDTRSFLSEILNDSTPFFITA